jgi:type I restriction-modification system DNA methylase subunit
MFYRYISENLTNYINKGEHAAGNTDFDYIALSDEKAEFAREDLVNEKGFFIKPSEFFAISERKHLMMITLTKRLKKSSVILRSLRRVLTVKMILQACLMILM